MYSSWLERPKKTILPLSLNFSTEVLWWPQTQSDFALDSVRLDAGRHLITISLSRETKKPLEDLLDASMPSLKPGWLGMVCDIYSVRGARCLWSGIPNRLVARADHS